MDLFDQDDAPRSDGDDLPLTFESLGLSEPVLRALADMGYDCPTPVQAAVVPLVRSGLDLIIQAQTGTGKTAAFGLPIAERFSGEDRGVRALVITPTRELALQVAAEVDSLGRHKSLRTATVYGGVALGPQMRTIERAQLVVGTPGRLLDHLRRGTLVLDQVQICILDEADEMLSMGFLEDVEAILQHLPAQRQFLLASATMPPDVHRLSQRYMTAPEFVSLSSDTVAAEQVQHYYYMMLGRSRLQELLRLIAQENPETAIIFCNTRSDSALVASALQSKGYDAEVINGDLQQREREAIMARCKQGQLRFMVATDVAARGIDISGLAYVFNYQLPEQVDMYIHRTGRTGRAGRTGKAISLIAPQEMGSFYFLRKTYALDMKYLELPAEEKPADAFAGVLERALLAEARLAANGGSRPRSSEEDRPSRPGAGRGRRFPRYDEDVLPGNDQPTPGNEAVPNDLPPRAHSESGPADRNDRDRPSHAPHGDRPLREGRSRTARGREATGERPTRHASGEGRSSSAAPPGGNPDRHRERSDSQGPRPGMIRLHLNAGKNTVGGREELRQRLAALVELPDATFGRIDIHPTYAFVEIPAEAEAGLLERVAGRQWQEGLPLFIERAREREKP